MSPNTEPNPTVVPAALDFLAIYNPSLGTTDETLAQQIVYFSSAVSREKHRASRAAGTKNQDLSEEENNERLRKIGLAQGMVEFGKSFSDGNSVDTIETEKSRLILHELEAGWWILASISLTQLPITQKVSGSDSSAPKIEYSSREVKPAQLLLQDLLRAHAIFLLHHASSISALFVRTRRPKFISTLGRYWDSYLSTWNVMMHANPAVDVYGGIKLAASGELGVGVGEEERGSGEREVLEGFVGRMDGLVDLVVCKFGDELSQKDAAVASKQSHSQTNPRPSQPWLGTGMQPSVEDGAIFLGTGAVSRNSLRSVTQWMEDLYTWGPHAYGVTINPTSSRRTTRRRRRNGAGPPEHPEAEPTQQELPIRNGDAQKVSLKELTPSTTPIASPSKQRPSSSKESTPRASVAEEPKGYQSTSGSQSSLRARRPRIRRSNPSYSSANSVQSRGSGTGRTDKFLSFLKLGYGTHWSLGGDAQAPTTTQNRLSIDAPESAGIPPKVTDLVPHETEATERDPDLQAAKILAAVSDSDAHFLIGLLGNLDDEDGSDTELDEATYAVQALPENESRMLLRTVTVELERESDARPEENISIDLGADDYRPASAHNGSSEHTGHSGTSYDSQDRNKTKKLRVIVYAQRPFIYAFLYELRTDSLAYPSLYRALHHQLGPLQKPLLASTKHLLPRPDISNTGEEASSAPIYDLIWDPKSLTIMSSIPSIPDPIPREDGDRGWSRMEALNTHMQILNLYASTRKERGELERTSKTSRGWWVVWARIPDTETSEKSDRKPQPSLTNDASPLKLEMKNDRKSLKRTVSTTQSSATLPNDSMYSGPAHPFLEERREEEYVPKDKEIFLIRQASDHISAKTMSGRIVSGTGMGYMAEGWSAPAKLAAGIGVDTKRYIEGLLNMGR